MNKGTMWMIAAGLTVLLAGVPMAYGSGGGHDGAESAKAMTPAETIKAAVQGNEQFIGHHDSHYFDAYQTGQTPNLTVISCADSRVHTGLFGMNPNNNIFIIRNIGNQVGTSEGSVDYGVRHLPTSILMVMGHSGCDAIKAAMGDYSGDGPFATRWAQNVERNADYQVQQAMHLYADRIQAGNLAVVGAVYDFNDNYGKGRGTLVITNINGMTDPNQLMNNRLLRQLPKAEIVNHVSSIAPAATW